MTQSVYAIFSSSLLTTDQKFPLAIALLHFLNITMQVAKEGYLNEFINAKKSALKVIQTLYVSIIEYFYRTWSIGDYNEAKFHNYIQHNIEDKIRAQWFSFIKSHTLAPKNSSRKRFRSMSIIGNKKIE